jgi:hypothetical protein
MCVCVDAMLTGGQGSNERAGREEAFGGGRLFHLRVSASRPRWSLFSYKLHLHPTPDRTPSTPEPLPLGISTRATLGTTTRRQKESSQVGAQRGRDLTFLPLPLSPLPHSPLPRIILFLLANT